MILGDQLSKRDKYLNELKLILNSATRKILTYGYFFGDVACYQF